MNRIPKKAQRQIDAANRVRAQRATILSEQVSALPVPHRLAVGQTPDPVLALFDVYFNGQQQFLCRVADARRGFVIRWTAGTGRKPSKDAVLETLWGTVEIRRKGT